MDETRSSVCGDIPTSDGACDGVGGYTAFDDDRASEIFADTLNRNGVQVERLEVTIGANGKVELISATIISEGEVAYEPTIRLPCTEDGGRVTG